MKTILKTVSEFYQRNLINENSKALDVLRKYGITSKNTIDTFEVGHASPDLMDAITEEQQEELFNVGLLTNKGLRFQSCISFPLYDSEGRIVDFLTRSLGKQAQLRSISDTPCGIGNPNVLKITDEVICTNYPMTALELHQSGHKNVILVPHAESFKQFKAKRITILAPRHADELAVHAQADEVFYANLRQRDKRAADALKRLKMFKGIAPVAKPKKSTLLDKIVMDLEKLGYAGEERNKKICYLVALSRKLKRPLSAIIVSSSGAGKSTLMRLVCELVPEDDRIQLSRLTPQALYHLPKDALNEKLLVVDEKEGAGPADHSIRSLQTSSSLTMANANKGKDEDSIKTIKVNCSYMASTTSSDLNPENANRCLILHLDESAKATEEVLRAQRNQRISSVKQNHDDVIEWHHKFQRELKPYPVVIPFVNLLTFPNHKVSFRRTQEIFLSLIEACTLLNQAERQVVGGALEATIEDYREAYELFVSVFNDAEREVSLNAISLLDQMKEENISGFTMRQAISITGMSYGTLHRAIQDLLSYEYISQNNDAKGRHLKVYTILDYSDYINSTSRLLNPQELSSKYQPTIQELSNNNPEVDDGLDLDIFENFGNDSQESS